MWNRFEEALERFLLSQDLILDEEIARSWNMKILRKIEKKLYKNCKGRFREAVAVKFLNYLI